MLFDHIVAHPAKVPLGRCRPLDPVCHLAHVFVVHQVAAAPHTKRSETLPPGNRRSVQYNEAPIANKSAHAAIAGTLTPIPTTGTRQRQ